MWSSWGSAIIWELLKFVICILYFLCVLTSWVAGIGWLLFNVICLHILFWIMREVWILPSCTFESFLFYSTDSEWMLGGHAFPKSSDLAWLITDILGQSSFTHLEDINLPYQLPTCFLLPCWRWNKQIILHWGLGAEGKQGEGALGIPLLKAIIDQFSFLQLHQYQSHVILQLWYLLLSSGVFGWITGICSKREHTMLWTKGCDANQCLVV